MKATVALHRLTLVALALVSWGLAGCAKHPSDEVTDPLLLPTLAAQEHDISSLTVVLPGNSAQVRLVRRESVWRVVERDDWLADPDLVDTLLTSLIELRGAERKTTDPALYPRLGLAPITAPQGSGIQLQINSKDKPQRLLIGIDHPGGGHTYVRVDGQAQTWLADRALVVPREPSDWLEHSLLEIPLLRIVSVKVATADAPGFSLVRGADEFRLRTEGADLAADTARAESLAGLLAPLALDDLERDDGSQAERVLQFLTVDGMRVTVQAWRRQGRIWFRLSASIDAERADHWYQQSGRQVNVSGLQARAQALSARTRGYAFLLPSYPSSVLMLGREQLLAKSQ